MYKVERGVRRIDTRSKNKNSRCSLNEHHAIEQEVEKMRNGHSYHKSEPTRTSSRRVVAWWFPYSNKRQKRITLIPLLVSSLSHLTFSLVCPSSLCFVLHCCTFSASLYLSCVYLLCFFALYLSYLHFSLSNAHGLANSFNLLSWFHPIWCMP